MLLALAIVAWAVTGMWMLGVALIIVIIVADAICRKLGGSL